MRTTLTIDQDVLLAARDCARIEDRTIGDVISGWARAGLASDHPAACAEDNWLIEQGFALLPYRDAMVTNADVNRLRDELSI